MKQSTTITTMPSNNALHMVKQQNKVQPFGAHFTTKLEGVNSKLVCALSRERITTCIDDMCGGNPICE